MPGVPDNGVPATPSLDSQVVGHGGLPNIYQQFTHSQAFSQRHAEHEFVLASAHLSLTDRALPPSWAPDPEAFPG